MAYYVEITALVIKLDAQSWTLWCVW